MNAIIYTTNTGSTERYAKLLAQKTGLPVYSLAEAKKRVFAGAEVIYLGWIMAGSVKGYAEAAKRYRVRAVCGVGMGQTGTQTDSTRKKSAIPANIPLFTLQGNFDVKKLHSILSHLKGVIRERMQLRERNLNDYFLLRFRLFGWRGLFARFLLHGFFRHCVPPVGI